MANVSSNNLTTLYSGGGVNIRPTSAYGNSNVVSLLNAGTDGGNTVTNIVATGNLTIDNITANSNVTADYFIGNLVGNVSNANYANFAGNLINGTSNVNTNGSGGNISISVGGVANVATFANNSIDLNYPINTPNNVFIGNGAGNRTIGQNSYIAIGRNAGKGIQTGTIGTIAIGWEAGNTAQGNGSVSIGYRTGSTQGDAAVSIGYRSGENGQLDGSVAIGSEAGQRQGIFAVAIGQSAGMNSQQTYSIAIGAAAGLANQAGNSVAIGVNAGNQFQGANSIAIGARAGWTNQANNSIIINATGSNLNQTTANTFTVKPVRNANTSNIMFYDNSTGEITYDLISNATIANANYANFAGTAFSVSGSNVSGEVANANYASFANVASTANSVAGANVSGEVANANYASFANIAASANSVAVANVSGIGNIAVLNLDGSSSNVLFGNGVFAPESTSIANANYANFAGTVITNAQPNITSVGNLTSLLVTGNTTFANALIFSGNSGADIVGVDNSSNATARSIRIRGAETTSPNVTSNTFGGVLNFTGGNANADIDPGSRWDGRGGNVIFGGGNGSTANGNGIGGNLVLFSGSGFSNLNPATGGLVTITAGQATGANGNSTGGSITILTGRANSTTTGTSTSGNINFQIGTANGVSGNVIGSINIGSQAANANIASPTSINIGQANTPTNIGGNANVTGNLTSGNANLGNLAIANFFSGNGSLLTGIVATNANFANFAGNVTVSSQPNITSVANSFSSGQLTLNTTTAGNPLITMNGVVGSSNGKIILNQGIFQVFNEDLLGGQAPFQFNIYGNSAYQEPINYFRARGTQGSPANCVAGDTVLDQRWQVYANSSIQGIFRVGAQYQGFTSGVGAYGLYGFYTGGDTANSTVEFQAGNINLQGAVNVSNNLGIGTGNALIYANGYINTNNEIDYLRTFGSFTSNATQTNGNVGNAVYMTLNNDEGSNGVSIVSSSQITVARTGRYNLQFSAQLEKTDSGTDQVEIWLTKNGSAVANSATQLELAGNGAKAVAAWNWVDNVTSANTYYQIAWGSNDANVQLTAIDSANTFSGVNVPSLIVTVVPVGA